MWTFGNGWFQNTNRRQGEDAKISRLCLYLRQVIGSNRGLLVYKERKVQAAVLLKDIQKHYNKAIAEVTKGTKRKD